MRGRMNCEKCRDTGKIIKNKKEVTCECKVKLLYDRLLHYRNVGEIPDVIKKSAKNMISKPGPTRLFLFDNPKKNIVGLSLTIFWKKYIAYYLFKSKSVMSWRELDLNYLTNLYMGSANHGLEEVAIEDMFYHFKEGTFILTYSGGINTKIHVDVLRMFLDHYRDRNILLFMSSDTAERQFSWLRQRTDMTYVIKE